MSLPYPDLGPAIEDYAINDGETDCDQTVQPGTLAFRNFVVTNTGSGTSQPALEILRGCDKGGPSGHWSGRAWDWMGDISDPVVAEHVATVLDWLLAADRYGNPHAMARRLGIVYIISNRKIWSGRTQQWSDYTKPGGDPHTSHVHFSLGWPGARAETSAYPWLAAGAVDGGTPPRSTPGARPPVDLRPLFATVCGLVAGFMTTTWITKRMMQWSRP